MSLRIQYRRGAPRQKTSDVFFESFASVTGMPESDVYGPDNNYGSLTKEIVQFVSLVTEVDATSKTSRTFNYLPGTGTEIYVNHGSQKELKGIIKGLEFKKILFSIWIGDDPPVGKN